jgi:hypothetical protein
VGATCCFIFVPAGGSAAEITLNLFVAVMAKALSSRLKAIPQALWSRALKAKKV